MSTEAKTEIRIGVPQSPVLNAYMASRGLVDFIMGPLGSGKTFGSIQKLLLMAAEQEPNALGIRPTRWAIVRNTHVDLRATTMKDFEEIFKEGEMGRWNREPPATFFLNIVLQDGTEAHAEYIFMALDQPSDVRKLRSTQFTGAYLAETKELHKAILDMIMGRIGRYPSKIAGEVMCSRKTIIGDTNACDDDHWYYKIAEEDTPEGWTFFRQPGGVIELKGAQDADGKPVFRVNRNSDGMPRYENANNLDPMYYDHQLGAKDPDWLRVNLCNEYGFYVEGKPVHDAYIDSLHCPGIIEPIDQPIILGCDFGRTPAAAILQVDPVTDRKIQIDEFCTFDSSASIFGPDLKRYVSKKYPGLPVKAWGDPAGDDKGQVSEDTPYDLMRAAGLPVNKAPTNATLARRTALDRPLRELCSDGKPRFMLSSACKMTRKGLRGGFAYRRIQVSSERYTDEPDKNRYSHVCEGLEYALLGLGEYHQAVRSNSGKGRKRKRGSYRVRS